MTERWLLVEAPEHVRAAAAVVREFFDDPCFEVEPRRCSSDGFEIRVIFTQYCVIPVGKSEDMASFGGLASEVRDAFYAQLAKLAEAAQ